MCRSSFFKEELNEISRCSYEPASAPPPADEARRKSFCETLRKANLKAAVMLHRITPFPHPCQGLLASVYGSLQTFGSGDGIDIPALEELYASIWLPIKSEGFYGSKRKNCPFSAQASSSHSGCRAGEKELSAPFISRRRVSKL